MRLVPCQMGAALVPVVALVGERPRIAVPVGALDRLDLDDVGAERPEVAGQVGTGPERGEVEHPQPGEGQRPGRSVQRSAVTGPRRSRRPRQWRRTWLRHRGFREPEWWPGPPKRPGVDEEPPLGVLRAIEHGGAVVDGRGRNPQRLSEFHDLGDGLAGKHRLSFGEEVGALRAAEHDRELVLAELGQAEHRADVEPVLARQAVDADPAVGGPHHAQHGRRPQVGGQAEPSHPLGHQHRIRQRGQQRFQLGDIDFGDLPGGV